MHSIKLLLQFGHIIPRIKLSGTEEQKQASTTWGTLLDAFHVLCHRVASQLR